MYAVMLLRLQDIALMKKLSQEEEKGPEISDFFSEIYFRVNLLLSLSIFLSSFLAPFISSIQLYPRFGIFRICLIFTKRSVWIRIRIGGLEEF